MTWNLKTSKSSLTQHKLCWAPTDIAVVLQVIVLLCPWPGELSPWYAVIVETEKTHLLKMSFSGKNFSWHSLFLAAVRFFFFLIALLCKFFTIYSREQAVMIWPAPRQSDWSHFWPPCTHWQRDLLESRSSQALESPLCWDFHCCFWHGCPFLGLHPPHLFNWPKAYFWPKLLGVPLQPLRTSGKHFFGLVNNAYFPPVHSSKIYAKARILTFPCKDPRSFYCPWPAYNCSYFFHFAAISTKKGVGRRS